MRYESGGFDLGIYDQAVWQYSRFIFPYNTIKERLILGDHLTLTLPLLAPLYWIWSDVRMLLLFQAVWISLSVVAVYLIARLRKLSFFIALSVSLLYGLFPGIQFALFFDFHPVLIGVGLLPWIAYFLEKQNYRVMWIGIVLLLLTQENMGLALASLGILYIFNRSYRLIAIQFIIVGCIASAIAVTIVSMASPIGFEYTPQLPKSIWSFVQQLFNESEKRQSWIFSYGWYSFIPLVHPGTFLATVIDFSQYFTTGNQFSRMWSPYAHHRAILAPYLTLGFIHVLALLQKRNITVFPLVIIVLCVSAYQQYHYHLPLNKLTKSEFWKNESWMKDTDTLIAMIPKNYAVAAQHNIAPHLSQRKDIYIAWPRQHVATDTRCKFSEDIVATDCWWLDFPDTATYLVVSVRPNQWLTQILESNEHFSDAISSMERNNAITLVQSVGFARLYKIHQNWSD